MEAATGTSAVSRLSAFLFSTRGRITRKQLWSFVGAWLVVSFVVDRLVLLNLSHANVGALLNQEVNNPLVVTMRLRALVGLVMGVLAIIPCIKRFHDRSMSGWWVVWTPVIAFAPFILGALLNIDFVALGSVPSGMVAGWYFATLVAAFVVLLVLKGRPGENRFGPDPLG